MSVFIHVIDAFTNKPFSGNPAGVCILPEPAPEIWMQQVANEMNLSETAFLHATATGFNLRWFTPSVEVDLCGHATLASAFALWETGSVSTRDELCFSTRSGVLRCRYSEGWVEMDFPAKPCKPMDPPEGLAEALGCRIFYSGSNGMDYLVEVGDESSLRGLRPDFTALSRFAVRGVIVTAPSDRPEFDFVSRFFAPAAGVNEDPVTGSAHCALGPHWMAKLGGDEKVGFQCSARGGVVKVRVCGDRALISGQAVLMSRVELL
jgi:PhzF family phenazine biosynthesis protein